MRGDDRGNCLPPARPRRGRAGGRQFWRIFWGGLADRGVRGRRAEWGWLRRGRGLDGERATREARWAQPDGGWKPRAGMGLRKRGDRRQVQCTPSDYEGQGERGEESSLGRRWDGGDAPSDVSTRSGQCVQFLAACVHFRGKCVQFGEGCVHFDGACVQFLAKCVQLFATCAPWVQPPARREYSCFGKLRTGFDRLRAGSGGPRNGYSWGRGRSGSGRWCFRCPGRGRVNRCSI